MLKFAALLVTFVPSCLAFSMGPPLEACWSMYPLGHGPGAQKTTSPYTITVNATSYRPNDVIEVFLDTIPNNQGIAFFEGLMIQARLIDCKDKLNQIGQGEFSLQNGENFLGLMDCNRNNKSAIVHIDHAHIYNRTFYWHAPSTSVGHIYFTGTVVRRTTTFWTEISSAVVKDPTSLKKPELCSTSGAEPIFIHLKIVVWTTTIFFAYFLY